MEARTEDGAARRMSTGRPVETAQRDTPSLKAQTERTLRSDRSERARPGDVCVVCWRTPTDRAHLVDRSLAPDPFEDPLRTVPLCRQHHEAYDAHQLDLLGELGVHHRQEIATAVLVHPGGLLGALERITGHRWQPC